MYLLYAVFQKETIQLICLSKGVVPPNNTNREKAILNILGLTKHCNKNQVCLLTSWSKTGDRELCFTVIYVHRLQPSCDTTIFNYSQEREREHRGLHRLGGIWLSMAYITFVHILMCITQSHSLNLIARETWKYSHSSVPVGDWF